MRFLAKKGHSCARFTGAINGANWSSELYRLADWLTNLPKPCGIMAYADICAKRIYDACHIARLPIPDQIRIIGIDNDINLCENLSPTLTSIEPDFERSGYLAGRLLFDRLRKSSPPKPTRLEFGTKSVIERASTQDVKGGGRAMPEGSGTGLASIFATLSSAAAVAFSNAFTRLSASRETMKSGAGVSGTNVVPSAFAVGAAQRLPMRSTKCASSGSRSESTIPFLRPSSA